MTYYPFWITVAEQLDELETARTAEDVVRTLSKERNPNGPGGVAGDGFFAGSGGDETVQERLLKAGWQMLWSQASYYYAMTAPDGSIITYIEGDIYTRDTRAN